MKRLKKSVLFTLSLAESFEFTYDHLYTLVLYAPVSVRGAVAALKDESLVHVYTRDGQTRIQLTSLGKERLKALFPALNPSSASLHQRRWTVALFLPTIGKRLLIGKIKQLLINKRFFALDHCVFCSPETAPEELVGQIQALGAMDLVTIIESRRFILGDEQLLVRKYFDIKKIAFQANLFYKTLITIGNSLADKDKIHPQTRMAVLNLLPKLMEFFAENILLPAQYFPQEIKLSELKSQLNQVAAILLPKL